MTPDRADGSDGRVATATHGDSHVKVLLRVGAAAVGVRLGGRRGGVDSLPLEYGGGERLVGADGRGVRLLDDPLRRHVLCGHEGGRV